MGGRIFALVGPSGAGQATLLAAAQSRLPDIHVVPDSGGEAIDGVTDEDFARRKAAGEFALDWQAHGLSYGIPAEVDDRLARGQTVVFNGSRAMLEAAARRFAGLRVILVTAPLPVLATRLAARGRESRTDIEERLLRAVTQPVPPGIDVSEIDNSGDLAPAVDAFLALLQAPRG
jgi:ribose 1,5-bisphosphokinase